MRLLFYAFIVLFSLQANAFSLNIDSLKKTLLRKEIDTVSIKTIIKIGELYQQQNKDSALRYFDLATEYSRKINSNSFISKSLIGKATVLFSTGNFDKAVLICDELIRHNSAIIAKEGKSQLFETKKDLSTAYVYLGFINSNKGVYDKAMHNFMKALKIKVEINDKLGIAKCYGNIGNVYLYQENFKKSIEYFNLALKGFQEHNDVKGMMNCYICLGVNFYNNGKEYLNKKYSIDSVNRQNEKAIYNYLKAQKLAEDANDKSGMSYCYNNIAMIYSQQAGLSSNYEAEKLTNEALKYYSKSLEILEQLNDRASISNCLINIADLYLRQYKQNISRNAKFLNLAFDNARRSYQLAKEIKSDHLLKNSSKVLMQCFKEKGDFKQSLQYAEELLAVQDTMFRADKTKAIADAEGKYQNEKKQKEIELLNKDKDLQKAELVKQKTQKFAFIGGFVLMIILAFVILRSYSEKKRANLILTERNAEILQQKEEIQAQAEQLEFTNKELEKLSIVASETDNSIVIANRNGEIEWANSGFTKLYGYSLEMFKQKFGNNILKSSNNENIKYVIEECIRKKQSVVYTSKAVTKSEKNIWVQTTLTPILDRYFNLEKLVAIDSDITKLKEAEHEILEQKEELRAKGEQLEITNKELERKNIQIMDSIQYAKLIQLAILPTSDQFLKVFSEHFILYKPKDIVSGDFYWLHESGGYIYTAVADCTGHGVPGAFMSMIGNTMLNDIINVSPCIKPSEILEHLNIKIVKALKQNSDDLLSQDDGMDITLCRINKETGEVLIATANHYYIVSVDGNIIASDVGKNSIGGQLGARNKCKFEDDEFKFKSSAVIYMFSDGLIDQVGYTEGKKLTSKNFNEVIFDVKSLPLHAQYEKLSSFSESWIGKNKQIDDILVLAIKV